MDNTGRSKASIRDIMNNRVEKLPESKRAELPKDYIDYRPKLYRSLALPSYVHGYSLAIEFMRSWFLKNFPEGYFKVVHINGKHVLDDWKHFNNYNVKREKPMLAIVPTVEYDYDRDNVDMYMMDQTMLLKRSEYQQSFFKDYQHMTFLYMQLRELRMDFNFKIRVNSRSEQLDLFNRMELWFRIGATQYKNLSADFHIPYSIMADLAHDVGFDLCNGKIKDEDIMSFLSYVNVHSSLPIIYKMRAINQKPEFFVRVNNLYTHISTKDKLQIDDGEREGKLDTNFQIEMPCILTIPIPHFFVYFNQQPLVETIPVKEWEPDMIGIYSINNFEIPPYNDKEWGLVATTSYACEKGEEFVDLSPILTGNANICKVLARSVKNYINPISFMEIKAYYQDDKAKSLPITMDYNTNRMCFKETINYDQAIIIVIYADNKYINSIMLTIEQEENIDGRITPTQIPDRNKDAKTTENLK